ncbi:MAG TPA: hypothetical protein VF092_24135 [Longimicrobium sp.]
MRTRMLTGLSAAVLTLAGGTYLTVVPANAAASSLDCMSQAIEIYNFVQSNICKSETSCEFQCTSNNQSVESFSCSCG